jgi:hypothetical protein
VSGATRRLCGGLLALLVAAVLGLAALFLRLGEGPLPLPPLAHALERAASAQLEGGAAVEIGEAAIAWNGWRDGAAAPLDIRLSALKLRDAEGHVRGELPEAAAHVSVRALLRGALAFATVELRPPRLPWWRTADGEFASPRAAGSTAGRARRRPRPPPRPAVPSATGPAHPAPPTRGLRPHCAATGCRRRDVVADLALGRSGR